jgi:hypothetical protein
MLMSPLKIKRPFSLAKISGGLKIISCAHKIISYQQDNKSLPQDNVLWPQDNILRSKDNKLWPQYKKYYKSHIIKSSILTPFILYTFVSA